MRNRIYVFIAWIIAAGEGGSREFQSAGAHLFTVSNDRSAAPEPKIFYLYPLL
jgi:hypothetical protein